MQQISTPLKIKLSETCKGCGATYPYTTQHFSMCNECHQIYCTVKCLKDCEVCFTRSVCWLCAESNRDRYRTCGRKFICRACAQLHSFL